MELLSWLCLVLVLVGGGVLGGLLLYGRVMADRQASLGEAEAKLQVGWEALHTVQRLNTAFWNARQAMRREADDARRQGEQSEP